MKKLTILVCVLLLLLSACTETVEPNTPSEPGAAPIESEPDITVSGDFEELPDDWMPPSLELYRETEAGESVWIASQVARNGTGEYIHTWYLCDFRDLSETRQTFLFGWVERTEDGTHGIIFCTAATVRGIMRMP